MSDVDSRQKQLERLYDFAELAVRIFQLYEEVRVPMTRELLLGELHQRLHQLNGGKDLRPFKAYLTLLSRFLVELPSRPEHIEAAIVCAEQLSAALERSFLSREIAIE